ncbi:MAG: TatD family hydrolase [Bacteroidia bacterium]
MAPVPFRGKRNESGYILEVARKLAEVKNTDLQEVETITEANSREVFSIQ